MTTLTSLLLALLGSSLPALELHADPALHAPARSLHVPGAQASWEAPSLYIPGETFIAEITLVGAAETGSTLPTWLLNSGAFSVNGRLLSERTEDGSFFIDPGTEIKLRMDLGSALGSIEGIEARSIQLAYGMAGMVEPISVKWMQAAEKGIDFMTLPVEQLANYQVVLVTNRGIMRVECWPETAPNHVRNFLDLSYTGFYDGTLFHRVIPGFMIQGGRARSGSKAPRQMDAEFSTKRHTPGVLSMARLGHDINSASSEFFVMHANYPSLDGKYSAFGQLIEGLPVVEKIVQSGNKAFPNPNDPRGHKPPVDQVIEKALVVRTPRRVPGDR